MDVYMCTPKRVVKFNAEIIIVEISWGGDQIVKASSKQLIHVHNCLDMQQNQKIPKELRSELMKGEGAIQKRDLVDIEFTPVIWGLCNWSCCGQRHHTDHTC